MEWHEFAQHPCPVCGSIEYRDYGGSYHCREGHRNAELVEMVGDEDDDFLRSRMSMRGTQLSASRLTATTSSVKARKQRHRSGRGDHDLNARYGLSAEEQERLFTQERTRFKRTGDLSSYVAMEAMQQIILHQLAALREDQSLGWTDEQFERCEWFARRLFGAYASTVTFSYSHTDREHPELAFPPEPTDLRRKRSLIRAAVGLLELGGSGSGSGVGDGNDEDDLDQELFLSDHDYSREEPLTEDEAGEAEKRAEAESIESSPTQAASTSQTKQTEQTEKVFDYSIQPGNGFNFIKGARPFANPLSSHNATLITYLSLLFAGVPVLLDDLVWRMERGFLPGYHPDFILSKDIVTARLTSRGLLRFYTRHIPAAAELYANTELMLRHLSLQCNVVDWAVNAEAILARLLVTLCIPAALLPLFSRLVLPRCTPLKFKMVGGDVFAGPCAQVAAGIVFVCRLMFFDDVDADGDGVDAGSVDDETGSVDADTATNSTATNNTNTDTNNYNNYGNYGNFDQRLVDAWNARLRSLRNRFNDPDHCHQPLTDPDAYTDLLATTNALLYNRLLKESLDAAPNIFSKPAVRDVLALGCRHGRSFRDFCPESESEPEPMGEWVFSTAADFLPSLRRYVKYPENVNLEATDERYQLLLEVVERTVGVRGYDLHRLICRIFE